MNENINLETKPLITRKERILKAQQAETFEDIDPETKKDILEIAEKNITGTLKPLSFTKFYKFSTYKNKGDYKPYMDTMMEYATTEFKEILKEELEKIDTKFIPAKKLVEQYEKESDKN
ncbi:MAG: hypothetical protein NTZ44_00990 [Candidatus Nomurabacteria bacterium]|nr:hypothetical protein [Candidatus Nomurabacteria bacterium]